MHNIVILGGNFGGVSTAHYLLRHVLPLLNSTGGAKPEYKVTLISPSDHTYFKIAASRALISVEKVPLDKPFASISDAFSQYETSEFTFIQGEAIQLDEGAKIVSIRGFGASKSTSVQYDSLIIATGTTSASPLWTLHGGYENTVAAFEDLHKRLPQAKTILIAGGGAAGVETAGEIASTYKSSEITLLSGSTRLLSHLKHAGVAPGAEKKLSSLNVNVVHNIKVTSSTELSNGKTSVKLSDGSTKIVDVYINATGGKPNTSFLPATWLDERQRVVTDMGTLRATKAPIGVYSIGDVASYSKGSVPDVSWAVPALGYSIWADLHKGDEKTHSSNSAGLVALKEKKYKQIEADLQVVPIGPSGGVGVLFGWRIPSFFVWLLKARTMMLHKAAGLATGVEFMKP